MKKILFLFISVIALVSCAEDDSTLLFPDQNPDFSKITIESELKTLSVDYLNTLVFEPEINQRVSEFPLDYEWILYKIKDEKRHDPKVISEEKKLVYIANEEGVYDLRLEAKNKFYSVFKDWRLNVRINDNGILVMGMNPSGVANFAFARTLSETDKDEGKEMTFKLNAIKSVNPDVEIKNVVHIGRTKRNFGDDIIFVYTEESIFVINQTTFEVLGEVILAERGYPGVKIKSVSHIDSAFLPILLFLDNGTTLVFERDEFLLYSRELYSGIFDKLYGQLDYSRGRSMYNYTVFLNHSESKLYSVHPYYGKVPYSNTARFQQGSFVEDVVPNDFEEHDIVNVCNFNGDVYKGLNTNVFAVSTSKSNPKSVKVVEYNILGRGFAKNSEIEYVSVEPVTLTSESQMVANVRYASMYYSNGNKIYKWTPLNASANYLPSVASIEIDEGKEITCLTISKDLRQLYVGYYDPSASDSNKGGVYIYDCVDIGSVAGLKPTQKFENISYKPVQVVYKSLQYTGFDYN